MHTLRLSLSMLYDGVVTFPMHEWSGWRMERAACNEEG